MRMLDIILKKRDGEELTKDEIDFFVQEYVAGRMPDYQASALLMAIYFQGMTSRETADLTLAMAYSGETVDLSPIPGIKVDKHSTGGVGDTTTLVVAPLVAACGVPVAKMSGRGLGHTGGTIDKLESIPGFNPFQSIEDFIRIVKEVGVAVVGQTENLVPADKKLYALRDVTGTVEHKSLIASSVMSKKIAAGADAIVLDVKAGSGAFMESVEEAFELAQEMVSVGIRVGRSTTAVVTDMSQPLGMAIGNALEVREAIEILKGERTGALKEVSLLLGAYMLYTAGRCQTVKQGREMVEEALDSGKGAQKLKEMIRAEGGDERVVDNPSLLPVAEEVIAIKAQRGGYISSMDARSIGQAARLLGAGRNTKEDKIDHRVGIVLHKRVGERVEKGETLAEFYLTKEENLQEAIDTFSRGVIIDEQPPQTKPLVYGVVTREGVERW
ncbi:pyrimidine-nucleoside phosphorylase [Caldicoprobacter faecalis]|uniref:Pyrimidine-nucleoside phosphorylase n=1 Tax=Caldicoprobacter faecalis TaxID=937334 RepID=A0A1I5WZB0_9FIRM|nr:pyrimidine-nucleoside phosphorylase [Caldicoprobacter faecalis]SFQ24837.1 pyrimidine-nucleoside phosphorylase [Caldicoprobacter faecalis]